jgi:hypothetical protein
MIRKLSRPQKILLYTFSILCLIARFVTLGWTLLVFFWIIIPFYALHLCGQFLTYRRTNLDVKSKVLVYLSAFLLFILTLIQHDCADNRCYYLIDNIYSIFTGKYFLPSPKEGFFSWPTITLFIVDSLISIYLLILYSRRNKVAVSNNTADTLANSN